MRLLKITSSMQGLDLPHCHCPPPIPQAVDTAIANAQAFRPPAAEPDLSSAPEETNILRGIAQESENAGHRLKSWAEEQATIVLLHSKFAQEMEQHGERMIALSKNMKELACDRDAAIYTEGFALGSSSSG